MRQTDIAIVGGGMAGSTTAAMLSRAGVDALLIDPHDTYPADFRCEKLDASQVALLAKTGLTDAVLPAVETNDVIWIARRGRIVEKRPSGQFYAPYESFVNAMRGAVGGSVEMVAGKVAAIATSGDRQTVTLTDGETISARLVVLATGLNHSLRTSLGIGRQEISPAHSISVGFDIAPASGARFRFRAMTVHGDNPRRGVAYLSMFPFGGTATRANLFLYRDKKDPLLKRLQDAPKAALLELLPGLERLIGPFAIAGPVHIRPADLYAAVDIAKDGIVLVGDAFGTSCPAAGTGFNKVLTDVERLCHVHLPHWLATPGMGADKIAAFYADPVKAATDAESLERAMLTRAVATATGLRWRLRRGVRYVAQVAVGALRGLRAREPGGVALRGAGDAK